MRKLFFIVLCFISLQAVAQTPTVTKTEVNTLINAKLTNYVKPSDFKVVARKLSDFAGQGDSIARTKEPFIVPGSSGAYLNGLKQWVAFPDLSIYSQNGHTHGWSVITGKPTTVATSGITDAVSVAGSQTLTGKTIAGASNTITLTSAQITGPLGYTPVNPASTPSLVPAGFDTQNIGTSVNYYANSFFRKLNLNSTASIDGATDGKVNIIGVIKGNGAEITGIPYSTGITDKPFIPTNVDYVDMSTNQDVSGSKTFNNAANFVNSWIGYQAIFGKTYNNAARIGFRDGTGIISGVVGYGSATSAGEFQFRAGSQSAFVNAGNSSLTMFSDGNILAQTGGTAVNAGYKVDIQGTTRMSGNVDFGGNVVPVVDNSQGIGTAAKRIGSVYSANVFASNYIGTVGTTTYGVNSIDKNIDWRSGSATQLVGGVFPSGNSFIQSRGVRPDDNTAGLQISHDVTAVSGKAWGQTFTPILRASANNDELIGTVIAPSLQPGAFTNVKMYALRVGGDIKLDGGIEFASWLVPQADNLYDIGSGVNRVRSLFTSSAIANNFTGTKGATTFGVNNSSYNIDFRQGSTSQFVAGFHPSGNMYIQPRGVRPSDSGEGLQVTGSSLLAGEFKTTIGTAGFKTSNVVGLDFITLHHSSDTPSLSNFVLGMSQTSSATFIGSVGSVATYINGSQKLKVSSAETSVHNLLRIAAAPEFADNAAAISGGMTSGQIYRTGDLLKIVH